MVDRLWSEWLEDESVDELLLRDANTAGSRLGGKSSCSDHLKINFFLHK